MTQWRIVEGTNDEGHPDICNWDLIYYAQYDLVLDLASFLEKYKYKRIRIRISEKTPNKTPLFQKVATKEVNEK